MLIESARLIIYAPKISDLDEQYLLQSNPRVMRYVGNGMRTKEDVRIILEKAIIHQQKHGFSLGPVYEKETRRFIGRAGIIYLDFDDTQKDIEIGYALLPEYWGYGYATELAKSCIDWGFDNISIEKLLAVTRVDNKASQNVLMKAGMSYKKQSTYQGKEVKYYEIHRNNKNS